MSQGREAVRGGRWFLGGLVATCVFALGHFGGFLQAARAARSDPNMAELTRAMRGHTASLLGFHPSILDFREHFSLNFSILLWLSAALGYAAYASSTERQRTIRVLSPCYLAAMMALVGSSALFSVPQGLVGGACVAGLFCLAWARSR